MSRTKKIFVGAAIGFGAGAMGPCNPKDFSQKVETISEIANCLFCPVAQKPTKTDQEQLN
jgi:hypothetical protein